MADNVAKKGNNVNVHYKGTLTDGTVFDSSEGRDPLAFELGAGMVVPGFDAAVDGMTVGETKTVTLPKDQAYGDRREDMIVSIPKAQFPPDMKPEVGMQIGLNGPGGQPIPATIMEVGEADVKLDANHALAGKDLVFEITLVSIG